MNSVSLMGRLTRDPEVRYTNDNMAIATFTLAVDRIGKDKEADFIRCKAFGKLAEIVERYITKGRQIAITGRISTGSYDHKDGYKVYTTDIICDRVEFCGSNSNNGGTTESNQVAEGFEEMLDSIPF